MTSENHALLDAIRSVVQEAIAPPSNRINVLAERFDGLTQRVDGLAEQMQRFENEQRQQRFLLQSIDLRLTNLEARI